MVDAKRELVHRKIDLLVQQLANGQGEKIKLYFYDIFDAILEETHEIRQSKADSSDIGKLIIEMREGFQRMDARFEQIDKRFAETLHHMDKRFEQMDKRFAELLHYVDKRFEQVEKRFEQVDKRFEQVDKRFEQVDKRFEQVDKRFEQMDSRFNRIYHFLMWMLGLIATGFIGIYTKLFFAL